jgi:hypothetical protein
MQRRTRIRRSRAMLPDSLGLTTQVPSAIRGDFAVSARFFGLAR